VRPKNTKEYIERQTAESQVNNTAAGKVTAVTTDGRHTVRLDGGRQIMVYSATGSNYAVGDTVGIRYFGSDRRQAEIMGGTTRKLAGEIKRVWR
jgi:hypothetical protein